MKSGASTSARNCGPPSARCLADHDAGRSCWSCRSCRTPNTCCPSSRRKKSAMDILNEVSAFRARLRKTQRNSRRSPVGRFLDCEGLALTRGRDDKSKKADCRRLNGNRLPHFVQPAGRAGASVASSPCFLPPQSSRPRKRGPFNFPCPSVWSVAKPHFKMASLPEIRPRSADTPSAKLLSLLLRGAHACRGAAPGTPPPEIPSIPNASNFSATPCSGLVLAEALYSDHVRTARVEANFRSCRALRSPPAPRSPPPPSGLGLPAFIDAGDDAPASARIRETDSSAENALEALVGAVYRDAGYLWRARPLVLRAPQ